MSGQFDASKQKLADTIQKVGFAVATPNYGGPMESFDFTSQNLYEIWNLLKESQMKDKEIRKLKSVNMKLADNNRQLTHNAIKALKTRDNKIRNLTDVLKSNDHYKKNLELKAELDALKSRSKYWSKKDYGSRVETRRAMSKQEHFLTSTPDEEFKGFQTREELDNDFKQWRKKEREAERTMEQLVDEMEVCEKDDNLEEEEDSDGWKKLDFSEEDEKEAEGIEK
ncbi:hypothetical protein GCK72_016010 [Caenorhabditis remanei]|uniref:Uncharacterized protein n=1 Tax=Caenorhabditis remanei TaxID=31234 RepID=A0A6A5GYR8_CAERE|nr:hypothetical protein GCK72_016010 [Caenorhabditis remanei]KAF1759543.1 hypothetical protein GCK72_016010 [Caenorhabditis remanei]